MEECLSTVTYNDGQISSCGNTVFNHIARIRSVVL